MVEAQRNYVGSIVGGRYRVLGVLGHGGMGSVYTAEHTLTRRRVALKVLRTQIDLEPDQLEPMRARFLSEARNAAAVSHPNIVDVLDMGTDQEGAPYLVLELLEGLTLDRLLKERGPLSCEQALQYLLPIVGALATLHDAEIVHRDVKPSNIFLRQVARNVVVPKLLDFGLAHAVADSRITRSGVVMGTPLYMAPEHAAGEQTGPAADVWSLGVVFYESISGQSPYKDRDRAALATQVLAGLTRPLSSVAPQVPAPFAYAIERALRRDLNQRSPNMRAWACALASGAKASQLALPVAPDPVGLPDFHGEESANEAPAETVSMAIQVSRAALPAGPPPAEPTRPIASQPIAAPRRAHSKVALGLGVSLVSALGIAVYTWPTQQTARLSQRSASHSAAAAAPRVVAPSPAQPRDPLAEAPLLSSEPSPQVEAAPPSAETPKDVRRPKSAKRMQPRPQTDSAPANARPATEPNPLQVERDWR